MFALVDAYAFQAYASRIDLTHKNRNSSLLIISEWIFGVFLCKLVSYCQGVSVTASVSTLVAIALDRCLSIVWPFMAGFSMRAALTVIWSVALVMNVPWLFVFHLDRMALDYGADKAHKAMGSVCIESWPSPGLGNFFFVFANLCMSYLVPLLVITVCNVLIWRAVVRRPVVGEDLHGRHHRQIRSGKLKACMHAIIGQLKRIN